ncbi:hypothetical protein BDF20DRAFT_820678, partial [Mycotypha africana]|uniref:uncharacterized protein n=1 Tax=Mycotypha africana TaxID=64632 RepID=UPI002300F12E
LVFLKEDDEGNIHDETGAEAMDNVDEKPDLNASIQLVNLDSYLKKALSFPPTINILDKAKKK